MPQTEDLLFEQSYLNGLARYGLAEDSPEQLNLPAVLVSAAYGYTRGGLHSPLNAALFAFFATQFPLISAMVVTVDAVFLNDTPAARAAGQLYAKHGYKLRSGAGLTGLRSSRCRKGYRRRGGVCRRVR